MPADGEIALYTQSRLLIFDTSITPSKNTRTAQGVAAFALKRGQRVITAMPLEAAGVSNPARYRIKTLPGAGALIKEEDALEKQISL